MKKVFEDKIWRNSLNTIRPVNKDHQTEREIKYGLYLQLALIQGFIQLNYSMVFYVNKCALKNGFGNALIR